jgi:predicted nucleic acid-binding protein
MIIADTGFLVSAFARQEKHHTAAQSWLSIHTDALVTVEAVISECSFFLQGSARLQLLKAVSAGALALQHPLPQDHARIATLAEKYQDQDADYADLALIWLAEQANCTRILTLDDSDFSFYRIHGRKRFELIQWRS